MSIARNRCGSSIGNFRLTAAEPCGVPGVYVDNQRAAEEICTYLIERGAVEPWGPA